MKTSNASVLFCIAAVLAGVVWVAFGTDWPALRFTYVPVSDFAGKLGTLVLLSLIIERTLEVFLTVWRAHGAETLEAEVRQLEKAGKNLADPQKEEAQSRLEGKRQELLDYKATTQRYALPFGLVLGLLVAAFGVRVLSQFVEVTPRDGLDPRQWACFCLVDIVFTGALLAGGSDPIHRLMNLYRKFMDSTTSSAAEPKAAKAQT